MCVTLVDCDNIVQQKVEIGAWVDRSDQSVSWLPARRRQLRLWYLVILNSVEEGK